MYYLLPFHFQPMGNREILTNDLGDYLILPRGSVQKIVNREIQPTEDLYKDLLASFFISETFGQYGHQVGYQKKFLGRIHGSSYLCYDTTVQSELHLLPSLKPG